MSKNRIKPCVDIETIAQRLKARDAEVVANGYAAEDAPAEVEITQSELLRVAGYHLPCATLCANAPNDIRALLNLVRWQEERIAELEQCTI